MCARAFAFAKKKNGREFENWGLKEREKVLRHQLSALMEDERLDEQSDLSVLSDWQNV